MINCIIDAFRTQARQHKVIKAFCYNRTYEIGSGKEQYPLFWLEDPIVGHNKDNVFVNSVNFSILFIPDSKYLITDLQNLAYSSGLNIIEHIKSNRTSPISIRPDWTYTTLRNYYDDNACGCRFSVNFTQANMQNLCLIDEQFDEDKEFETTTPLSEFDVIPANKCEIFINKLPEFNLRTSK